MDGRLSGASAGMHSVSRPRLMLTATDQATDVQGCTNIAGAGMRRSDGRGAFFRLFFELKYIHVLHHAGGYRRPKLFLIILSR